PKSRLTVRRMIGRRCRRFGSVPAIPQLAAVVHYHRSWSLLWPGARLMNLTVEATYENGTLKLAEPLPLKEHEKVRVTIEPELNWAQSTSGMLQWKGDFADLRRIVEDDEFGIRESHRDDV